MSEGYTNDTLSTTRFAIVPEWVLYQASARACKLYAVLDRHGDGNGRCFPSRRRLADLTGCSVDTVDRALAELVDLGAIVKRERYDEHGDRTSNEYIIRHDPPGLDDGEAGGVAAKMRRGSRKDAVVNESKPLEGKATALNKGLKVCESSSVAVALPSSAPPKIIQVNGRNLPFDALAHECEADPEARAGEIAKALQRIGKLAWAALDEPMRSDLAAAPGGAWAEWLACEVARRAALYRRAFGDEISCTPTALAKWWNDVERHSARAARRGMTPAEIASSGVMEAAQAAYRERRR